MEKRRTRPLALCLFRNNDCILVNRDIDPHSKEHYYRPLGGGIEFQELGKDAIFREIKEELAQEITAIKLVGVLENIFTFNNQPHHEIVMVYDAQFIDKSLYQKTALIGAESNGHPINAVWKPLNDFGKQGKGEILYPDGLLDMLLK